MWYVFSCSENWRTNIKFSRLTHTLLLLHTRPHLNRLENWRESYFPKVQVGSQVTAWNWRLFYGKTYCLPFKVMLVANCHPAQLDEVHSGNVSCKNTYFGSCFWSFSEAIYLFPQFLVSANKYKETKKVMPVFRNFLSKPRK